MTSDPRLQSVPLLTLAAYRLQQRRQQQVPDWRYTEGISALLAAARRVPRRDLGAVEASDTGLGLLLQQARAWHKEERYGA